MEASPLTGVQQDLADAGFDARLIGVDAENLYERLFVVFDADHQGRPQILQLSFLNDILALTGQLDGPEDVFLLQFAMELPFRVPERACADVARLLLTLNTVLPMGALGFLEGVGQVYFSHILATPDKAVDAAVSGNLVGMVGELVPAFAPLIESVADGSRSREDVIQELVDQQVLAPALPVPLSPGYDAVLKP
jgi:hypothetical protein